MRHDPTALRLVRRALNVFSLGRGTLAASGAAPIQTVQIKILTTGELRSNVPFMQHYGLGSRPHITCDYTTVTLEGDPGKGVIIASNDQRYNVPLVEGEVALFDDQAQKVHLQRAGITVIDKSKNSIVTTASGITVTDLFGNKITTTSAGTTVTDATGSTIVMQGGIIALNPSGGIIQLNGQITGGTTGGDAHVLQGSLATTGDQVAGSGSANISQIGHIHGNVQTGAGSTAPPTTGT